jgi:cell division protein FtsQ
MWDKPQALRQLANSLFGISLLLVLFGALHYLVHMPEFPLRQVQLSAAPQRVDIAQIEAVVRNEVRGNFFTVDLEGTRQAFERLPWVRKVSVRRDFPWRLEVTLEEHEALARWNGAELVNTHGEVFAGSTEQALPKFIGQPDTAAEVTQMYGAFGKLLAPLKHEVAQISLSPRRAWQLRLDNGMVLELGREQAEQRLARFVAVYPYSLAPMQQSYAIFNAGKTPHENGQQRTVNYVDLRYSNGFAAYLPGGVASGDSGQGQGKQS